MGHRPRSIAWALGGAGAAALAAGGATPATSHVHHVIELVRGAEAGALALLAVPRALDAPGLCAAGILHRFVWGWGEARTGLREAGSWENGQGEGGGINVCHEVFSYPRCTPLIFFYILTS